jgi:hypothetical protein
MENKEKEMLEKKIQVNLVNLTNPHSGWHHWKKSEKNHKVHESIIQCQMMKLKKINLIKNQEKNLG